jgi:hypothetical protein
LAIPEQKRADALAGSLGAAKVNLDVVAEIAQPVPLVSVTSAGIFFKEDRPEQRPYAERSDDIGS